MSERDAANRRAAIRARLDVYRKAGWSGVPSTGNPGWDGFCMSARELYAHAPEDIAYLLDQLAAQDAEIATLTKERDLWRREAKVQAGDRSEP